MWSRCNTIPKMKILCQLVQKLQPEKTHRHTYTDRHTDITKTLPLPHTRELIILCFAFRGILKSNHHAPSNILRHSFSDHNFYFHLNALKHAILNTKYMFLAWSKKSIAFRIILGIVLDKTTPANVSEVQLSSLQQNCINNFLV